MKNKKHIFVKHILSGFHAASSSDKLLYAIINPKDVDFVATEENRVNSNVNSFLNGEIVSSIREDKSIKIVYFQSEKTLYELAKSKGGFGIDYSNDPVFQEIINDYINKGFSTEKPAEVTAFYKRQEEKEFKKRQKSGFVVCKPFNEMKTKDYQGGLSDDVFNSPAFQKYISSCPFGWIGHGVRTKKLDVIIEAELRQRGLSSSKMFNWPSSSDGRHFGDSLEGFSLKEQIQKIKNHANEMFNLCLIYGDDEHKGTWECTKKIREKLQNKG